MEIRGKMNLSDYSNIYDYIAIVQRNDDFSICTISLDNEDINMICSMLKELNFIIKVKDYSKGNCLMKVCKNL